MKKTLVLGLVFILIAAAAGFSDDIEKLSFSISGDASVTWGIDLDNTATGFVNAFSSNLEITIVPEADAEKGTDADGAVYGYILLENFKWVVGTTTVVTGVTGTDTDTIPDGQIDTITVTTANVASAPVMPSITAKVKANPVWIQIYSKPGIAPNKASINTYLGVVTSGNNLSGDIDSTGTGTTGGINVGIDTEVFDASIQFISFGSYVDADLNTDNDYAIGLTTSVSASGFAFDVAAGYYLGTTTNLDASASVSYEIGLGGDMALKPVAGFDMNLSGTLDMEASLGLYLKLAAGGYDQDIDFKIIGDDRKMTPGLYVGFDFDLPEGGSDADLTVAYWEPSGDDGVIPVIGAGVFFELADILSAMDMGVGVVIDANISGVKPYAAMKAVGFMSTLALTAEVGVDIPLFANTTLSLDWTSGDLAAATAVLGDVTLKLKIAY